MMDRFVYFLNALWILIYCLIISGAFGLQIFKNEVPCPLCYLQRVAMISVSMAAFLNLFYGVRPIHYAMALFASLVGAVVAIRQILLHVCPGFPEFGVPFWGISLYTWSFLTFVCSVFMTAVLLCLYRPSQGSRLEPLNLFSKFVIGYLCFIIVANIISVALECGLGLCD